MPGYGVSEGEAGLLPWSWGRKRLEKSHNYWISTTRPDGAPHAMAVWGVWVDDRFYFSTGRQSRKARNLKKNPRCVVSTERAREAVIVEGVAAEAKRPAGLKDVGRAYKVKYKWELDPKLGPIFVMRPRVAFGFIEDPKKFETAATRWKFETAGA